MYDRNIYQKFELILGQKEVLKLRVNSRDGNNSYRKYIKVFDYCYKSLSDEHREILNKTYINKNYRFWWVDRYSKSSYYRKRIIAITSFVHLFEFIYENFVHFHIHIDNAR